MSLSVLSAIIVFFAAAILSQRIAVNAGARLDEATKLKLMEVFPKRNANYTLVVFGMIVVFLIAIYAFPQDLSALTIGYGVAFAIYLFTKMYLNLRKLKEIDAPSEYIRSIAMSFGVFIGGAVAAVIVFAVSSRFAD